MATGAPYDRSVTTPRLQPLLGARVRPGPLAPVVVAIVLGILGMHGISAHGTDRHGSVTRAATATPAAAVVPDHRSGAAHGTDAHSVGNASGSDAAGSDAAGSDAAGRPAGHAEGTGGMVMMCVAMLAGAAVALLTLLVRRARLPEAWASLGPAGRLRVAVPAVLRVGAGPPVVWRFSVIRC